MSATSQRWAQEVKQSVTGLKALRDEVKLQVRLGGMNAKTRFQRLEHLLDTQQLNVRKHLHALAAEFRMLKDELTREAREAEKQNAKQPRPKRKPKTDRRTNGVL